MFDREERLVGGDLDLSFLELVRLFAWVLKGNPK